MDVRRLRSQVSFFAGCRAPTHLRLHWSLTLYEGLAVHTHLSISDYLFVGLQKDALSSRERSPVGCVG
jgi:hypothetical protein